MLIFALKIAGMYILLISLVIGLFVAMLFVNVYFRVRVIKAYKVLVQNRVEFDPVHVFNMRRLEAEILPRYSPDLQQAILTFVRHLQFSIKMATVLVTLITLFGGILMYFRD